MWFCAHWMSVGDFCPVLILLCSNCYFSLCFLLPVNVSISFLIPLSYSVFCYKTALFFHSDGSLSFIRLFILKAVIWVQFALVQREKRRVLLGLICPGCCLFPAFVGLTSSCSLPLTLQRKDGPKQFLCSWGIVSQIFQTVLMLSCGLMEMAFGPALLAVHCLSRKVYHMPWVVSEWKRFNNEKHMCSKRPVGLTLKKGLLEQEWMLLHDKCILINKWWFFPGILFCLQWLTSVALSQLIMYH